jgi:hypothetical protein
MQHAAEHTPGNFGLAGVRQRRFGGVMGFEIDGVAKASASSASHEQWSILRVPVVERSSYAPRPSSEK